MLNLLEINVFAGQLTLIYSGCNLLFLNFKLKYFKIHPSLPISYVFKMLFRMKAFFLREKILKKFNMLEDSQTNIFKSQPHFLTNVFLTNVFLIKKKYIFNHLIKS